MAEIEAEEGWHTLEDGTKLYTKTWKPDGPPRARVLFVHGFSDHCNAYFDFFPTLARRGIQVHGFDQRGWGRSAPSRLSHGATGSTTQVLSDMSSMLSSLLPPNGPSQPPLYLAGHSMGGAQILSYVSLGPASITSHIRGFLAESPFIALAASTKPVRATIIAGKLAGKILPRMQLKKPLDPNALSRNEVVRRAYIEDPLCHDTGTLGGLSGMLDRAANLESGKVKVMDGHGEGGKTRLWVGHGTIDGACDFNGTKAWFEKWVDVEDKTFSVYEGCSHKLHAEPDGDGERFCNDVADWILVRSGELPEAEERKVETRLSKL